MSAKHARRRKRGTCVDKRNEHRAAETYRSVAPQFSDSNMTLLPFTVTCKRRRFGAEHEMEKRRAIR